ncbi:hypothetical protein ACFO5K_25320 [Nocardia halotolerans]|uniref:Uncharacterized protein n=1 Tax=Nocardia halotolerans TaxID=1755878 RepID=A0ABV8VMX1_9NOCA
MEWPIVGMHGQECGAEMWRFAPILRTELDEDPVYRRMVREALDYIIGRGTNPVEWARCTDTEFFDQDELDEYLTAFYDYLFGDRPEPIYAPGNGRPPPGVVAETRSEAAK